MTVIRDHRAFAVRPVRQGDCEGLIALFNAKKGRAATCSFTRPHIPAAIRAKFEGNSPNDFRLVALDQDEIIAQAGLMVRRPSGTLTIHVRHDFRRCGIGSRLIESIIDEAGQRLAIHRIEAEAFDDNLPAIALYKTCGFERLGHRIDQHGRTVITLARASNGMNQKAVGRI